MRLGLLESVGLAATLMLALPAVLMGLEKLVAGETTLGAVLVTVGVLMVALPRYLTTPQDVPIAVAERVTGAALGDPDEDDERR